jgi:hypothetical protein
MLRRIGKYEILGQIGRDGQGTVFVSDTIGIFQGLDTFPIAARHTLKENDVS